ncbi:reverse transcriptase domain-containing protein [Tanacetum coccineum]
MGSITSLKCVLTQKHLDAICAKYFVPEEVHPQLPSPDATMHERPASKNLESVKNWNDHFFWVDEFVVPANARFSWFSGSNIVKDRAPVPSEYNVEHVNALIAQASPFLRFPEEFLCWVGISRNYLLNKDTYPRFEYENGEEMDLNAFIRTADPRKVRVIERARAKNERPIVTVAKHRTMTLLPTSVVRSSGELSASVEREFVGDVSVGDGGDQGFDSVGGQDAVEPIVPINGACREPTMEPLAVSLLRCPTLLPTPTLYYFIPVDCFTFGGRAEENHTDSGTGPSLRMWVPPEGLPAPVMTEDTNVTTIATSMVAYFLHDVGKDKSAPHPSVFGSSSSSKKTDRTLSLFTGSSGSGFAAGRVLSLMIAILRQKKRGQAAERNVAINDKFSKLVTAGIMREVHYHDWLSNLVMVKKSDNSWRMCVDFKDLNKHCPRTVTLAGGKETGKVEIPCVVIPFKCFLDAYTYKGYQQIQMQKGYMRREKDRVGYNQRHFMLQQKMPFGLRNAGATYQRLVDKTFHGQIGRNLECTFGVEEGMFLGYKVNTKGIKICPDKVDAVLSLQSPKFLKDVQRLNGKLASLNRFLAKSTEKSLLFFKTLKKCTKKSDFLWTEEAEAAFRQMKEHIAKLPMLIALEEQEELIVYLAASKEVVSVVLMTERETRQMPIYFVSRALRSLEVNYTAMEKLMLALVYASKRLRRYFQAHPIIVITDQPIKNILSNPEVAGRMQKWSIQLGEFGIHYRPRVSIKGQVLADFIIERPEEEGQDDSVKEEEPLLPRWTLFTDGSSCIDGCGAGVILTDPGGVEFTYTLRFQFEATNNKAEYEALIAELRIAEKIGVQNLEVNVDSKLVANQVNGTYIAKETDMIKYLEKVKELASTFQAFLIKQVPRSENKKADALSKTVSTNFAHLSKQVLVEELKEKSKNEREVLAVVEEEGDSWMTPIHEYLMDETLPAERKKARAIKRKLQRFFIINRILYKKSFLGPWLRCVGPSQARYVLREIHEGSCSMHAGTRSVVAKALRTGYYWPTMHKDARALIKACQECQVVDPTP